MIFAPIVIYHAQPQVTISASDSGSGPATPVTYAQIKRSLGNQVYNVKGLYIESSNLNQISGTIQFQRFDATGNQQYRSITPIIDPFQTSKSLVLDLNDGFFILNGNSNFNAVILPNTTVKATFYSDRITNNFGMQISNFDLMAELFRKKGFFKEYGDIEKIKETNEEILDSISESHVGKKYLERPKETSNGYFYFDGKKNNSSKYLIAAAASAIILSLGVIYFIKNRKSSM